MLKEETLFFFCLCFCHLAGVFGVELKSVMEGDSVTLQTNVPEVQRDELITWMFGTYRIIIARTDGVKSEILDVRFRDRLKLDEKTGSLTITNITTEHAGDYVVEISSSSDTIHRFTVTVYAATTPDLHSTSLSTSRPSRPPSGPPSGPSSGSSSGSSSGPSGPSSGSSSAASSSGPSSRLPSGPSSGSVFLIMLISAAAGFLFLVVSVGIFCIYRKQRKTNQQVETGEEITYADPTFYKRQNGQNTQKTEDDVIYAGVVTRR